MPKLSALLPWLDAHGVVLLSVLAALVAAWKAIPAARREAIELRFPRLVGVVRFVGALASDVIGAYRIARYQIAEGQPRASVQAPESTATTYAPPRAVEPETPTARHRRSDASPGFLRIPRVFGHVLVAGRALWSIITAHQVLRERARIDAERRARTQWGAPLACLVTLGLVLAGCPLPLPDGCTPRDTRCAPDGVPEVCSQGQRWTRGSPSEPCPERSTCCRARSPYGSRLLHACVPPSACLPESPAPSTPSALAGSQ